jgi:hypothetical protein
MALPSGPADSIHCPRTSDLLRRRERPPACPVYRVFCPARRGGTERDRWYRVKLEGGGGWVAASAVTSSP